MSAIAQIFTNPELYAATISMATPLALPAIGGTFSERTGVVNIAMEGNMLVGAFFAVMVAAATQQAWLGLLAGMLAGGILSLALAFTAIRLQSDQVIVGMALNLFASGLTAFLLNTVYGYNGTPTNTPFLPTITIPFLSTIPFIGPILGHHDVVVYLMLLIVAGSQYVLFHTKLGLRMRAVGENPEAADTVGIHVARIRYLGVFIGGLLSGLGGVYLSIGLLNAFDVNMTNGRGYIALAAMIFGKWTPLGSFGAALLFGFATALSIALQNVGISANLVSMLPYALTIIALTGLVGRSRAPAADGIPYAPSK
ncbi:ABC transporter permease [Ferroacidibacillus organovorans]|uniref:Branched-chain amino acid ABC transporter permease n=1 Tax=Ferroacidibacillus organovorans TaxID=1765683 RepID=A0A101XPD3_9BACL|nr:ABC transporter permease [Ferroacidibacillus organovorans]KUO94942.1 branched-chain amino acid ABC transporter permease [Ferroacidibacillus organovorans]